VQFKEAPELLFCGLETELLRLANQVINCSFDLAI
jgi:hypothetical protein